MKKDNLKTEHAKDNIVLSDRRSSSNRTICKQPLPNITCCYLAYGIGAKKWFEFYKDEEKVKDIFSESYFDALKKFMDWYQNYA